MKRLLITILLYTCAHTCIHAQNIIIYSRENYDFSWKRFDHTNIVHICLNPNETFISPVDTTLHHYILPNTDNGPLGILSFKKHKQHILKYGKPKRGHFRIHFRIHSRIHSRIRVRADIINKIYKLKLVS